MAPDSSQNHDAGLAATVAQVSERATLLVREEIELAKAEMRVRIKKLAKGTIVGVAAGMFLAGAGLLLLWGGAFGLWSLIFVDGDNDIWAGFFILAGALTLLGLIAGLVAARAVRSGTPPKPEMAMEEARLIRETVGASKEGGS